MSSYQEKMPTTATKPKMTPVPPFNLGRAILGGASLEAVALALGLGTICWAETERVESGAVVTSLQLLTISVAGFIQSTAT